MIKKITENNIVRMVTALLACGVISAVVLVFVYQTTKPGILLNQEKEMQRSIENIFPEGEKFEQINDGLFRVLLPDGRTAGYAFTAAGNGYQGEIKLMVGAETDLATLKGIAVLESQETPGLGGEIQSADFLGQFRGLDVGRPVEYVRNRTPDDSNKIEAITGATISSSAVVTIINDGMVRARKELEGLR